MKKQSGWKKLKLVLFILLMFAAPTLSWSATISGTVRDSTGTAITGSIIRVNVYTGVPCRINNYVAGTWTTILSGTYAIAGLPAGTYYLKTNDNNHNYVGEWWNGESPDPSDYPCGLAQPITVTLEETVPGVDFRLELGATISGTVRDSTGTPITGANIIVAPNLSDPCNAGWIGTSDYNPANGTYVLVVPTGTYYLRTYDHGQNYVSEWWNGVGRYPSDFDCNLARSIPVEAGNTYLDYDFWLSIGVTIRGTIYNDDGSRTLARMNVCANSEGCYGAHYGCRVSDHNGNYTVSLLPPGTIAYLTADGRNYVREVYDGGSGSTDCNDALGVTAGSTGIHFYLENSSQGIGPAVNLLLVGEP